jgi:CRP/FNR family cyclic AMP-dependent transcriptional regulator
MNNDPFLILETLPLFQDLPALELAALKSISNMHKQKKADAIFYNENTSQRIYLVIDGTLKVCSEDETGKEIISEMLAAGDIFGQFDFGLREQSDKREYARVLSDGAKMICFKVDDFQRMLEKHPNLFYLYSTLLLEKITAFERKYKDLIFKSLEQRVDDFFKRYAKHHSQIKDGKSSADMMLTHQEIADYTAGSRQSVTTIINKMITDGKIEYIGRKSVVFNFVV